MCYFCAAVSFHLLSNYLAHLHSLVQRPDAPFNSDDFRDLRLTLTPLARLLIDGYATLAGHGVELEISESRQAKSVKALKDALVWLPGAKHQAQLAVEAKQLKHPARSIQYRIRRAARLQNIYLDLSQSAKTKMRDKTFTLPWLEKALQDAVEGK